MLNQRKNAKIIVLLVQQLVFGRLPEKAERKIKKWAKRRPENKRFLKNLQKKGWVGEQLNIYDEVDLGEQLRIIKQKIRASGDQIDD
jgi:hypothetical protein